MNRKPTGNRAFVLPTTLLVMTLLTIMLTAAFTMVSAEYRTTDNSFGRARAHALAQAGLQTYYSLNRPLTGTYDSTRITLSGGYADLVARRLRDSTPTQRAVWLVRSFATSTDPTQPGQVRGRRTIVQLAHYNPADFPAQAALFAVNGVHVAGGPAGVNPIVGTDASYCFPLEDRSSLVFPAGRYSEDINDSPANDDQLASPAAVLAATRIDWPSLLAGNFTPDYELPAGPVVWTAKAVILVNGDYTLNGSLIPNPSSGILIVTGNLTLVNLPHWHGVIIVGGYIRTGTSNYSIHGMTITGMNIALGASVPPDTIGRGYGSFHWRSCEYGPAIQSLAGLMPIGNAWADTWSSY